MDKLLSAIKNNLQWFRSSGVLSPAAGEWGVAERIAVLEGNEAAGKILESFPARTFHDGYAILEHRRSDCNFETALMFLLAADFLGGAEDRRTAENLLDFLYFRSGLLNRNTTDVPPGTWNWASAFWAHNIWFDDDGWCAAIQILIGLRYPDLDRKYGCLEWGVRLSKELLTGFDRTFNPALDSEPEIICDPERVFVGKLSLPHWGMPPVCAFLAAYHVNRDPAFLDAVRRYAEYLRRRLNAFNASELSYALIGIPLAAMLAPDEPLFPELGRRIASELTDRMAANSHGNLPSEHFEAPNGPHLVDTIYTVNWALLGLVNLTGWLRLPEHRRALDRLVELLVDIQDTSESPVYRGCWRGMFDLNARAWGGGDCYEGGANSIYTGWTNAPITIGLMLAHSRLSFADLAAAPTPADGR